MSVHAQTVYSCFHITVAELMSCKTPYNLQGLALYQKTCQPLLQSIGKSFLTGKLEIMLPTYGGWEGASQHIE